MFERILGDISTVMQIRHIELCVLSSFSFPKEIRLYILVKNLFENFNCISPALPYKKDISSLYVSEGA